MEFRGSSLKELIHKPEDVAKRGNVKGHLPFEPFFGFCRAPKQVTKNISFNLNRKTADLQYLIYTTKSIDRVYLCIPTDLSDTATQGVFNDSLKSSFNFSFDSRYPDRKVIDDNIEIQLHIGSASNIISPKSLKSCPPSSSYIRTSEENY